VSRSERSHRTRTEQAYRAFKRQVISLAACNPVPAPIEIDAVLRGGSMVFAVWQSSSELDGVGVLIIKGQPYLRAIIVDNQPLPRNCRVIECQSYAEACSLRCVD
jgi:hypothetical protein